MKTKLTLRLDDQLVRRAKKEAHRRGKSVSGMVAEYFDSLDAPAEQPLSLPPVTKSLAGLLRDSGLSEEDYRQHLREKHR